MSPIAEKVSTTLANTPLPSTVKTKLAERIKTEGATKEVVEAVKQAIRSHHARSLLSRPSIVDSKDPGLKEANKKFSQELRVATQNYLNEMAHIEKEAKTLSEDINNDLTRLQELVVQTTTDEAK